MIIPILLIVLVLDQVIKFLLLSRFPDLVVISARTFVFSNETAVVFSFLFLILLLGLYLRDKKITISRFLPSLGFGMSFGGAISNLIDRLVRGGVVDFSFKTANSNLADLCLLIGLILLFWFYFSRRSLEES